MWLGVKGNQGLNKLARDVRSALDAAGISYSKEAFVPHITLIRKAKGSWKQTPVPKAEMMVKKISVMKSEEKNGRVTYTELL